MSGVYLFFGGTIQNRTGEWRFCRPLPYRLAMVPNIDFTFLPSPLRGRWLLRAAPSKDGWGGRKSSTGRTRPPVQNLFDHSPDGQNCRWQPVLNLEPPQSDGGTRISVHLFLPRWGRNKWSGKRGSNPPPPPWQGGALPNELFPQVVPQSGVEPPTRGFSVPCSTY